MPLPIRLEHIGIAVADAEAARRLYKALFELRPYKTETVADEGVRTHFLWPGGAKLELLEALGPESPIARHLERRGPGLHHLAFEVADVDAAASHLGAAGFRVLGAGPKAGADGKRIFFLHPSDTGGVLIECCQASRPVWVETKNGEAVAGHPESPLVVLAAPEREQASGLAAELELSFRVVAVLADRLSTATGFGLVHWGLPDVLPGGFERIVLLDPSSVPDSERVLCIDFRGVLPGGPRVASVPGSLLDRVGARDRIVSELVRAFLT